MCRFATGVLLLSIFISYEDHFHPKGKQSQDIIKSLHAIISPAIEETRDGLSAHDVIDCVVKHICDTVLRQVRMANLASSLEITNKKRKPGTNGRKNRSEQSIGHSHTDQLGQSGRNSFPRCPPVQPIFLSTGWPVQTDTCHDTSGFTTARVLASLEPSLDPAYLSEMHGNGPFAPCPDEQGSLAINARFSSSSSSTNFTGPPWAPVSGDPQSFAINTAYYQYPTASTIPVCAPTSGDPQSLAVDMGIFSHSPQAPTPGASGSFAVGDNVSSQLVPETL
jgi:hypothetical protein